MANKKTDDLVLLYFSGHGVLDDRGRLYLALKDTQFDLLKATSIPSSFVADEMDSCRSKRQILILDCCHSGAFARGTKGEQKAITESTFEGSGFGRVVLTASDSTQYALEGDQVIKQTELSLFTHFLLEGLKTGEADVNNDGLIALDEWYDYTYTRVVSETPRQVPHKWSYNQQGDLIIARNPFVKKKVVELPYELTQALESSFVGIRESAVNELGKYLQSRDPEMVDLAVSSLQKMKEDDSRRIASLAERLLVEFQKLRTPIDTSAEQPKAGVNLQSVTTTEKPELELETENLPGVGAIEHPNMATEIKPSVQTAKSGIELEVSQIPALRQKLTFDMSFWVKWSGATFLGLLISIVPIRFLLIPLLDANPSLAFPLIFGVIGGSTSFIQWLIFRRQLDSWWIIANTVVGIVLGMFL